MELRQIRYFVMLAELLNFSKTARALYITQPTLSQQISELEKELGVKLLDRSRRKVALTKEGEFFYLGAKDILGRAEALSSSLYTEARQPRRCRILIGSGTLERSSVFRGLSRAADRLTESGLVNGVELSVARNAAQISLDQGYDALIFDHLPLLGSAPVSGPGAVLERDEMVLAAAGNLAGRYTLEELLSEKPLIFLNSDHDWADIPFLVTGACSVRPTIWVLNEWDSAILQVCMGKGVLILPKLCIPWVFRGIDVATWEFPRDKLDMSISIQCQWREGSAPAMEQFVRFYREAMADPEPPKTLF